MLDRFLNWFEEAKDDEAAGRSSVERAVCLLLVAAARADGEFQPAEAREIATLVSRQFNLPPEETAELVTMAAAEDQNDLYAPARLLNERFSRERRHQVLELMWRVVYSDGRLEAHEDALMHRVAKLLDIPHGDLIAIKLAARKPSAD